MNRTKVNMADVFGSIWRQEFLLAEADGNITQRKHNEFPNLVIANYTPKAAYEGAWNKVTVASRGLIYDVKTGDILARPFHKFFNYGQSGAPDADLDTLVYHAGDKFDGSLGIGYIRPDGQFAVATRGSFHSAQADHANELIRKRNDYSWYRGDVMVGYTPLFEIIYPENRIVLNYGDRDDLQFLGWIDMSSGKYLPPGATHEPYATTFRAVLERPQRKNAEGWVVWLDPYTAVKIKQEDYVALHKIVTGLNEKEVWRQIQAGPEAYKAFVASLPDELQKWAIDTGFDIALQYGAVMHNIDQLYLNVTDVAWAYSEGDNVTRKQFALAVQDSVPAAYRGFMFSLADGKDIQDKVWKMIEPKGESARPSSYLAEEDE